MSTHSPAGPSDRSGLVTIGQSLGVVRSGSPGPLGRASALSLSSAGAEANVAIGVRRLGFRATWIGHVGADALGDLVVRELQAEGVTLRVTRDPGRPTALMLNERRTADRTRVAYYRVDAAGAGLSAADIAPGTFADAALLHVTGITACLGDGPAEAVRAAVAAARAAGATVSLDANHRLALADDAAFAARVAPLVAAADLVFATVEEASVLSGETDPERQARALLAMGPAAAVVKRGPHGSLLATCDGIRHQAATATTVIDTVGAGDAFAAGFLAGMLGGLDDAGRMAQAAAVAAVCVATQGDWEGLPSAAELAALATAQDVVR